MAGISIWSLLLIFAIVLLLFGTKKLKNIEDIGFIELDNRDVVRHEVVRKIINAYEEKNRN